MQTPEDYALITRKLAEELLAQNVVYAEVTISDRRDAPPLAKYGSERSGDSLLAESVPFSRLKMAWIFDAARQFGREEALKVAR